jgi:hypothetical protein
LEARRGGEGGQPKALHSPAPGFGQPKALHLATAPDGGQPKALHATAGDGEHPNALQVCASEGDAGGTSQAIPALSVPIANNLLIFIGKLFSLLSSRKLFLLFAL